MKTKSPDYRGSSPLDVPTEMISNFALSFIEHYTRVNFFPPGRNWPSYWFWKRSFERWTAKELFDAIKSNPGVPPRQTIEDFITKLDHSDPSEPLGRLIMETAKDTATELLDALHTAFDI